MANLMGCHVHQVCEPNTFLPTVACGAQDPVLAVIKVNATVGWEESVGQFTCGTIKAVVHCRDQAVGVVDWVETYLEVTGTFRGHLTETEWGNITPHSKGSSQAPSRLFRA